MRRLGSFAIFTAELARAVLHHGVSWPRIIDEAWNIGIRSLPILIVIAGFVGTILSLQGYSAFKPLGGQRLVGMFVALAGVRELAPIIAAAMVAAKAGTEMASQLGVMRIDEQIDALEVMATNPLSFLVAPRLFGILMVMPALTAIATFSMMGAAFAVATWQLGVNPETFLEFAGRGIEVSDFFHGALKAMIFGIIICIVSCWYGLNCDAGPEGVGAATNKAVVVSAVICVIINYFASELLYGGSLG